MYVWINEQKEKDNSLADVMRVFYRLGKNAYILPILTTVLSIAVPLAYSSGEFWLFGVLLLILVLCLTFHILCENYEEKVSEQRKFASETINNQSSMINSLCIEIRDNEHWKHTVFKRVSELVCEKIRTLFKDVFKCDTRVSVEYVFDKPDRKEILQKFVKMSARRSPRRDSVKKSVLLEKRHLYYSYRIFNENIKGVNCKMKLDT